MKGRRILLAALCCAAVQTTVGWADQVPMIPQSGKIDGGFLYWSIGGTVQRTSLPRWSAPGFFVNEPGTPALTDGAAVTSAGPAFTLGYVFDGLPFGVRPRIEVAASYAAMGRSDASRGPVGAVYNEFRIVGGPSATFGGLDNQFFLHLRTKFDGGDAVVRFRTDFNVTPAITLSPGLGIVAGGSMLKYDYSIRQVSPLEPRPASHFVGDKLLSARIGTQAALDATWRVNDAIALTAGIDAQVYLQRSRLQARDCYSFGYSGESCDSALPPFGPQSLSETRNKIGGSLGASLGLTYNWGWAELSVTGFGRRVFNTPGVRNPSVTGELVSIRYENTWNYGGFLQLTFPLAGLMK